MVTLSKQAVAFMTQAEQITFWGSTDPDQRAMAARLQEQGYMSYRVPGYSEGLRPTLEGKAVMEISRGLTKPQLAFLKVAVRRGTVATTKAQKTMAHKLAARGLLGQVLFGFHPTAACWRVLELLQPQEDGPTEPRADEATK